MPAFSVVNLGCKVNRVESDGFEKTMSELGYTYSLPKDSDVVIVNTCTVTKDAEKKTRKAIRQSLRNNPFAEVIVTGCASAISPEFFEEMDERISVVSKADMEKELISRFRRHENSESDIEGQKGSSVHHINGAFIALGGSPSKISDLKTRSRLGIKIQDGCDNKCTYCIVCKARGASRSVSADRVLSEATAICERGIREIVLSGIDLGAYSDNGRSISDLLEELLDATRDIRDPDEYACRFRISSIEPTSITDKLIELIRVSEGRICAHLHIPLQSGSTKVLKEMNRHYGSDDYIKLIGNIRSRIPNISLTSDIIVGFPGETDDDFTQTVDVAKACGFSRIHIFPYSKREGTEAAERSDQIEAHIKDARISSLKNIAWKLRCDDMASRVHSKELFLVQENAKIMSESYYEFDAEDTLPTGKLVELSFGKRSLSGRL